MRCLRNFQVAHNIYRKLGNDVDTTDFKEVGDTLITCPLPWTQQNICLGDGNKIQWVHWDSKFVNSFKVSRGCANPSEDINFANSFVSVDENGYLRHKDCSFLIARDSKLTRCDTCYKGQNTLKKKELKTENLPND